MLAKLVGFAPLAAGISLGLEVLLAVPGSAAAVDPAAAPAGAWDLVLDTVHRQCRLTLKGESSGSGYDLAMPAGCRRAFAILGTVAEWSQSGDGRLRLDERGGQPVLTFEPGAKGLQATSPDGEIYRLQPVGPHKALQIQAAAASASPAPAGDTAVKSAQNVPVSTKPADIAGRYNVLRDKTKDTGCMVTLDEKSRGPKNTFKARLAPACRDQGIVIFDPVGWQVARGQLVLTARKGHTTELDPQDDGSWRNAPKQGKSLSLKKM